MKKAKNESHLDFDFPPGWVFNPGDWSPGLVWLPRRRLKTLGDPAVEWWFSVIISNYLVSISARECGPPPSSRVGRSKTGEQGIQSLFSPTIPRPPATMAARRRREAPPESEVDDIWTLASSAATGDDPGSSEAKADDVVEAGSSKTGVSLVRQHETYTLFVGQKQAGKSTLITAFHNPTKEDVPKADRRSGVSLRPTEHGRKPAEGCGTHMGARWGSPPLGPRKRPHHPSHRRKGRRGGGGGFVRRRIWSTPFLSGCKSCGSGPMSASRSCGRTTRRQQMPCCRLRLRGFPTITRIDQRYVHFRSRR